jgi:hypothetical protein
MVVDDTKAADSAGLEKREEEKVIANSAFFKNLYGTLLATQATASTL